jgi:hypothetical protein
MELGTGLDLTWTMIGTSEMWNLKLRLKWNQELYGICRQVYGGCGEDGSKYAIPRGCRGVGWTRP